MLVAPQAPAAEITVRMTLQKMLKEENMEVRWGDRVAKQDGAWKTPLGIRFEVADKKEAERLIKCGGIRWKGQLRKVQVWEHNKLARKDTPAGKKVEKPTPTPNGKKTESPPTAPKGYRTPRQGNSFAERKAAWEARQEKELANARWLAEEAAKKQQQWSRIRCFSCQGWAHRQAQCNPKTKEAGKKIQGKIGVKQVNEKCGFVIGEVTEEEDINSKRHKGPTPGPTPRC